MALVACIVVGAAMVTKPTLFFPSHSVCAHDNFGPGNTNSTDGDLDRLSNDTASDSNTSLNKELRSSCIYE